MAFLKPDFSNLQLVMLPALGVNLHVKGGHATGVDKLCVEGGHVTRPGSKKLCVRSGHATGLRGELCVEDGHVTGSGRVEC